MDAVQSIQYRTRYRVISIGRSIAESNFQAKVRNPLECIPRGRTR